MSTVGIDEETIREYIQKQEQEDKRSDQLDIFRSEKSLEDENKTAKKHRRGSLQYHHGFLRYGSIFHQ